MGISLTPLASLCLGVVRGWINVARRGKGGQIDDQGTAWTRLPAEQLRDQLSREFLVEVSTRSVQRALKELEEQNQIRREQRWKHRYKRDYWYAVTEHQQALEAHRPRSIAGNYQSQRSRQRGQDETTWASGQFLNTPLSKTQFSKTSHRNGANNHQRKVPTPMESETTRTRKETHMRGVLATCMEYGTNPPQQASIEPETSGTTGSKNQKRPSPQGFGASPTSGRAPAWHAGVQKNQAEPTPGRSPAGAAGGQNNQEESRNEGKLMREVWIGGICHLVADDPSTAPIR